MSPASQGTLEVERYIGSCLISSSGSHKNKKVQLSHRASAVAACENHRFNIYHASNSIVSLCQCGAGRYGAPSIGGNWTGMPLISMAPSNSRKNKKGNRNSSYPNQQALVNQTRTPLSRLAIHTQGAPLILSGRYNGRKEQRRNNSTPSSDCLSVASDESSGQSENSLPRIIKPRKRRKKDRKAPPVENKVEEVENSDTHSPSIVTLRPYIPLCYDIYGGRHDEGRWSLANEHVERKVKVWEIEKKHSYRLPYVIEVEADDEGLSHASDDDSLEPNLQHHFDEVEENEEGILLETNTSFPYHFPTTLCHCRYCDPSGLIWDIDQHYYSPLLTPPSPTSSNVPLYLSPSPPTILSLDYSAPTGLLHRSWSEPLHSKDCSEPDLGCTRIRQLDEAGNTKGTVNMFPSQSLEVSTEIVTSPNGHRDIEIKFYSSSPPAEVPEQCDMCSVDQSAIRLGEEVSQLHLSADKYETVTQL